MTGVDPHLLARASALYLAGVAIAAGWIAKRPSPRTAAAALLTSLWSLLTLLLLHVAAIRAGWWRYEAEGGLFLGIPLDLLVAWSVLWGAAALLAFERWPVALAALAAFAIDLILMPLCAPVVQLGPSWLVGETMAILFVFVPAQLLGRWTAHDRHLAGRAGLQMVAFSTLLLFVIPAIAIEGSGSSLSLPLFTSNHLSLVTQLLALPAIIGASAVQEFVTRGHGTPVPFDPPTRLVASGIYRYVRNPMQLSALLLLAMLGAFAGSKWLIGAAAMALVYSVGLAGWDEEGDLIERFGDRWRAYRAQVPRWVPRMRPWIAAGEPPARLYVADQCGMCREVGRWFLGRGATSLTIVAAESHPQPLTRITYDPGDNSAPESGVAAVARALEHIHLGWALVSCAVRLPIVVTFIQWIVDASGGEARRLEPRASCPGSSNEAEDRAIRLTGSATGARVTPS